MYSISADEPPESIPPLDELIEGRPSAWTGFEVRWKAPGLPSPVFIASFGLGGGSGAGAVHLFGLRYDLADAIIAGEDFSGSHFIEYVAVRMESGQWRARRLLQRDNSTYVVIAEGEDHVPAERLEKQAARLSVGAPPEWKWSRAHWPTTRGEPMQFVGQVALPETEITRTMLTWASTVFLFWDPATSSFKIVTEH